MALSLYLPLTCAQEKQCHESNFLLHSLGIILTNFSYSFPINKVPNFVFSELQAVVFKLFSTGTNLKKFTLQAAQASVAIMVPASCRLFNPHLIHIAESALSIS